MENIVYLPIKPSIPMTLIPASIRPENLTNIRFKYIKFKIFRSQYTVLFAPVEVVADKAHYGNTKIGTDRRHICFQS